MVSMTFRLFLCDVDKMAYSSGNADNSLDNVRFVRIFCSKGFLTERQLIVIVSVQVMNGIDELIMFVYRLN